ncbi:hypothetical protein, partial [Nonomuraea sp. NPDC049725]|uniref:hypothetical protein n=1 Tax=Nonomuraea sp. NPDC049725 TaxID=3154508 RepID=UPI00341DA0DB
GNIISVIFDEVLHEKLHALAFDTLLSSQETDACSPVLREALISLCLNSFSRSSLCQIDRTRSTCWNFDAPLTYQLARSAFASRTAHTEIT